MRDTGAFVLKKSERGEADFLYTLYTKDLGLIRATAQGIRKPKAKLAGHLEVLTESYISIVEGKGGYRLTGALMLDPLKKVQKELPRLAVAEALASLVIGSFFEEEDSSLWSVVSEFFHELNRPEELKDPDIALWWVSVRILVLLGYQPSGDSIFKETPGLKKIFLHYETHNLSSVLDEVLPHGAGPVIKDALRRAFLTHTNETHSFAKTPLSVTPDFTS